MGTLQELCDIANGKRRRFFPISPKAAALFKQWLADYRAAATLQEVLDQYEMGHLLDDYLQVRALCKGKHVEVEYVRPRAPWADGRNYRGPYNFNDELLYLVLTLVTTSGCEKLRLCLRPQCGKCFVARGGQKYCSGLCGRLDNSRRIVGENYKHKQKRRIRACRAAYAKYQLLNPKPRKPMAEYILHEANRHLPTTKKNDYKIGGPKMRVNFITQNEEEIGIPKGAK